MNIRTIDLFDLEHTKAADYLRQFEYPWQALVGIADFVEAYGRSLPQEEYDQIAENVWIAKDAVIYNKLSNYFKGPCVIGHRTEVRPGAFIRGSVLVGDDCVVGNSTELKNVILFDNVQVPHYNYVGDSILGYKAHMGAGSITSNVKSDKKNVVIHNKGEEHETGRKKIGGMIGDNVEVGCGSIINPGTIVGRCSNIYPLSSVRGCVPKNSIYKGEGDIVAKK